MRGSGDIPQHSPRLALLGSNQMASELSSGVHQGSGAAHPALSLRRVLPAAAALRGHPSCPALQVGAHTPPRGSPRSPKASNGQKLPLIQVEAPSKESIDAEQPGAGEP